MIEKPETICYVVQAKINGPLTLCVKDNRTEQFHAFPVSLHSASRLAAECSAVVNSALGGVNYQRALEEVSALWAANNVPPSES